MRADKIQDCVSTRCVAWTVWNRRLSKHCHESLSIGIQYRDHDAATTFGYLQPARSNNPVHVLRDERLGPTV